MPNSEYSIPNDPDVGPEDIVPIANLREVNLADAELVRADLSNADLKKSDFTNADLELADLTNADLEEGHFMNANLMRADLTDATLLGADLTDAYLSHSNLTDTDLLFTDLTGASLTEVDSTGAFLIGADLTDANLTNANLTNADLREADLTDANLRWADLTDANLSEADLTDADLRGANLTNAFLGEVDLSGITLSRSTLIDDPSDRIQNKLVSDDSISEEHQYDIIARTNHELRTAYSANGLTGRARRARVRERRARRKEAFAEGGLGGHTAWFGSLLSKAFTGYGVQLSWIAFVMGFIYLLSVAVYYCVGEMSIGQSLYYSVVTFTTSPPDPPPSGLTSVVAGIETFAGTAAIVFLGYVLGARERV